MDAMTRPLSKLNPYILGKSVATNHSSPNSSTFRTSNLSGKGGSLQLLNMPPKLNRMLPICQKGRG